MTFRAFAHVVIGMSCTLLVSCIDGHEEIWLNADGSGRANINYNIPAVAARFYGETRIKDLLRSVLKDMPASSYEITPRKDRLGIHVNLSFKSSDQLSGLTSQVSKTKAPASFEHLAGQFSLARSFRTVDFTRTISPGKALPTGLIPASQFRNRNLTYILHLPVVASESTATRTANGGRTLIWEKPLSQAIRQPVTIHFKAKFPFPKWLVLSVTGAGFLFALLTYMIIRKRNYRSPHNTVIPAVP